MYSLSKSRARATASSRRRFLLWGPGGCVDDRVRLAAAFEAARGGSASTAPLAGRVIVTPSCVSKRPM